MVTILIVYHSQSGNTRKMAEAVVRGAGEIEGVKGILKEALETGEEDLLDCDGTGVGFSGIFRVYVRGVKGSF